MTIKEEIEFIFKQIPIQLEYIENLIYDERKLAYYQRSINKRLDTGDGERGKYEELLKEADDAHLRKTEILYSAKDVLAMRLNRLKQLTT